MNLQDTYARQLQAGARLGLVVLVVLFVAYAAGWGTPLVPPEQLARVWGLPLAQYLPATGMPTGWGWLWPVARQGAVDVASLLGLVVLAGCSLPALGAVAWQAWRSGEPRLAWLCLAQALVLLVAASGWLTGPGHGGA